MSAGSGAPLDRWGVQPFKLRPPRAGRAGLARAALLERLAASPAPVVLVVGPAGYGKTTLARQWVEVDPRPAAWVALDEGDDDPVVLLRHVARALHEITPLPAVEASLVGPRPRVDAVVLPALATGLAAARSPVLLVLDDVHRVRESDALSLLDRLLGLMPDGSQVVLVGRSAPGLRLARRRLAGELFELNQADLAFTADEARAVLRVEVPDLSARDVEVLVHRTEGWPAGLHLAALALGTGAELRERLDEVPLADRHLVEYLQDELLAHLDQRTRTFLLKTSVLEQFTAGLCDAVTGQPGSQGVLDRLAAAGNLFVTALDEPGTWFRYHHLFAELLLGELRRVAAEDEAELRRRAGRWLSEHGLSEAAVQQATATGDIDFAAAVLHAQLPGAMGRGNTASVDRWLAAFSSDDAHRQPLLAFAQGIREFSHQRGRSVAHWVSVLEQVVDSGQRTASGLTGPVDLVVAVAALRMLGGFDGVADTEKAARTVRDAGPAASPWWGLSWLLEASARFASGASVDPVAEFTGAEMATRGLPSGHVNALANLALSHVLAGDDHAAAVRMREACAEARAEGLLDYRPMLPFHVVRSLVAARAGALDESRSAGALADQTLAAVPDGVPRGIVLGHLVLAEAALVRGERSVAQRHVRLASQRLQQDALATRFTEWAERLKAALVEAEGVGELTPAERRVLAELATHRSLEEIGQQLYLSRNTVKTHTISIYRKLGVSGRSAAVGRARALGLLER
jgi:LuxR family maltose regulon positive regulatory protein